MRREQRGTGEDDGDSEPLETTRPGYSEGTACRPTGARASGVGFVVERSDILLRRKSHPRVAVCGLSAVMRNIVDNPVRATDLRPSLFILAVILKTAVVRGH